MSKIPAKNKFNTRTKRCSPARNVRNVRNIRNKCNCPCCSQTRDVIILIPDNDPNVCTGCGRDIDHVDHTDDIVSLIAEKIVSKYLDEIIEEINAECDEEYNEEEEVEYGQEEDDDEEIEDGQEEDDDEDDDDEVVHGQEEDEDEEEREEHDASICDGCMKRKYSLNCVRELCGACCNDAKCKFHRKKPEKKQSTTNNAHNNSRKSRGRDNNGEIIYENKCAGCYTNIPSMNCIDILCAKCCTNVRCDRHNNST